MILAVVWGRLLALGAVLASGQTLDQATNALAQKVAAHLAPGEAALVSVRSLIPDGDADAARVQAAVERAIGRSAQDPTPTILVILTISENLKESLVVAEIQRDRERAVEIESFRRTRDTPARASIRIERKKIWEQDAPILDVAVMGDQLLVLDTTGVTRYESGARKERADIGAPAIRDPRGRMEVRENALTVYLPGVTCRGTWREGPALNCEPATADFTLLEHAVHFRAGRNTIEGAGWPPAGFENWEGDVTAVSGACGEGRIAASGPGDRDSADWVALVQVAGRAAVPAGDRVEFGGPVTALWPSENGVLAVMRNLSTSHYEAYSLTLDCGR